MDRESLNALESNADVAKIKTILHAFNEKHAKLFDFTQFNASGQWPVIWRAVFNILRNEQHTDVYPECLSCVRILSRDKIYLNSTIDAKDFDCLLKIAKLNDRSSQQLLEPSSVTVEALKCLCNIVFQSAKCQDMCSKNYAVDGILNRVKSPQIFPYDIEYFDMKLLILITALNVKTRNRVRDDLNGLAYLTEWLNLKINESDKSEQQIDLICQILKVLFNITISADEDSSLIENEIEYRRLTSIVRNLLLDYSSLKSESEIDLISNVVNLLNTVPTVCISELLVNAASVHPSSEVQVNVFQGKCVLAVDVLLEYLTRKLNGCRDSPGQYEILVPILAVLVKCVRSNSTLRHYIRSVILPPLKDVKKRPEEGDEVRNFLCRFLTVPYTELRFLAAELLFVCCKEDVGRMIKHTGYGNAAGLLANRGLLGGRSNPTVDYSSDSEDSDTAEYKTLQHGINPVLGCYEPPKPNPIEGMSDEQKEYEAMQLVNLMDKLHRQGIIQPCRIGDDGKPQPVEDIRQLQEEIPQQQMDHKKKT